MADSQAFWKNDAEFIAYNDTMLKNKFTFEEILDKSTFKSLSFKDPVEWNEIKEKWSDLVKEWNRIEGVDDTDGTEGEGELTAMGFVGNTYLMVVFPYDELKEASVFCQSEVEIFNRVYFYVREKYLPFKNLEDLISHPILPSAWSEYNKNRYNRASWWITYIIYERVKGKPHIIGPENRAQFK